MASSRSDKGAQVAKLCELCNGQKSVQWICVQCHTVICSECKRIHLNTPTCSNHEVVDFATGLERSWRPVVITDNIPCDSHKRRSYCMFCNTCDCLVCPECISGDHKRHDFESIDKVAQEKSGALQELRARLSDCLSICKSESANLPKVKQERTLHYDLAVMKINNCERELVESVQSYAANLRKDIEKEKESIFELLKERELQFKEAVRSLDPLHTKIMNTLTTKRADKIISCASEFDKGLPIFSFTKTPTNVLNFRQGKRSFHFEKVFGSLELSVVIGDQAKLNFSVIKSFTSKQRYVDPLALADEKAMWICDSESVTLKKVTINETIDTQLEKSIKAIDMAKTRRNELFLSVESDVKLLTEEGELKTFISVSPLLTRGIHVTRDDELLVGVREYGDPTKFTDKNCRKVVTFGMDGKEKQSYEFDENDKRMFTVPVRITSSANGDIVITDHESINHGRLVTISKWGKMKWSYNGIPTMKSFYPKGVVTTSTGYVIVTDLFNNCLHVLSDSGQLINYCILTDQGCIGPLSLAIDDDEESLWLGCSASSAQSNAKLHLLKIGLAR